MAGLAVIYDEIFTAADALELLERAEAAQASPQPATLDTSEA